jgi:hypothetical protein
MSFPRENIKTSRMLPRLKMTVWAVDLLLCPAIAFSGCGGVSGSGTPPPSQAVVIATQPRSQTVPLGNTATFTVTATGTAPLSYQWSENGSEIPGATAASYTTLPVALGEGGSTAAGSFQVTAAMLTIL